MWSPRGRPEKPAPEPVNPQPQIQADPEAEKLSRLGAQVSRILTLQSRVADEKAQVSEAAARLADLVIEQMPGDQISDSRWVYRLQAEGDDGFSLCAEGKDVPHAVALNQVDDMTDLSIRVKMSFVRRFEVVAGVFGWRSAEVAEGSKVELSDDPGIVEDAFRLTRLYAQGKAQREDVQLVSQAVAELAEFLALTNNGKLLIAGPWDYVVVDHGDGTVGLVAKYAEHEDVDLTDISLSTPHAIWAKQSFFNWFEKVTGDLEISHNRESAERRYAVRTADAWIRGTGLAE